MSIIDDIREAERKADRIRKEAKEKGKEIVKEAKTVAENNKKKRLTDYQNACDKKLKEAEEKQEVYLKTRLKAAARAYTSTTAAVAFVIMIEMFSGLLQVLIIASGFFAFHGLN